MAPPFDPRLLREARAARGLVVATTASVVATTAVVVAGALVLARAVAPVVTGEARLADVVGPVALVGVLFLLRSVLVALTEHLGHRGATAVIAQLRRRVLGRAARLGPRWAAAHGADTATLVTRGLDALDPYFTKYLPQLLSTAILTPAVLVVLAVQDVLAAVIIAIAIPLIPIFMWLVGVMTKEYADKRLAALERLGSQLLDLLAGLPTLRAFGRAFGPAARVRELAEASRRTTMSTLRVAFLSGAVLELISTITVAMVAVSVGLRLLGGEFPLVVGLAVLIMAPEVLLPLRQVGLQYHAAADGVAAAEQALAILDEAAPTGGSAAVGPVTAVVARGVGVRAGERAYLAPAGLDLRVEPGRITALAGPSGSGKSTAVDVLLGLLSPDEGSVTLETAAGPVPLAAADLAAWWAQVRWVPQRPVLEPGTIAELLGSPEPGVRDRAATATGLDAVVAALPGGWETALGQGGLGLSVGQRQRLALTRALLEPRAYLILDEPTAHLDAIAEEQVLAALRFAAEAGTGVLVIAHRPTLLERADVVIPVRSAQVVS